MDISGDIKLLINLFYWSWMLPRYWLGCILPSEWRWLYYSPKTVSKRLRPLEKIGKKGTEDFPDLWYYFDFAVIDLEDVTRDKALKLLSNLKLDVFGRTRFCDFRSSSSVDLIQLTLKHPECDAPLILYINKSSLNDNEEFADVEFEDRLSLIENEGFPLFLYNHSTHILINCDYRDIYARRSAGVMLQTKSSQAAGMAQNFVMHARSNGFLLDTGKQKPRAKQHLHDFDDLPLVQSNPLRHWYNYALFPLFFLVSYLIGQIRW